MNTPTCAEVRDSLSEFFDGRLSAGVAEGVARHLEACEPCDRNWRDYSALQRRMRKELATSSSIPAFIRPQSASTWLHGRTWRFPAAAAIAISLLSLTMFQLGRDSAPSAGANAAPEVLAASLFPQKLKDHSEGVNLLRRQMLIMPHDAAQEAEMLVRNQLDLLDKVKLEADVPISEWARADENAPCVKEYLDRWRETVRNLRAQLHHPGHTVADLQNTLADGALGRAIRSIADRTTSVPQAQWYSSSEGYAALRRICEQLKQQGADDDVCRYMEAHGAMLRAQLMDACQRFALLRGSMAMATGSPRTSRLEQSARFMQAECLRRCGHWVEAQQVLGSEAPLSLPEAHVAQLQNDPLLAQVLAIHEQQQQQGFVQMLGMPFLVRMSNGRMGITTRPVSIRIQWVKRGQCGNCGEEHR